ncbi:MAG: hypothetical protein HYX80_04525 [Chloroflexi bacterium]|nr:hypothetical protein [Chloroflexota bacterium]
MLVVALIFLSGCGYSQGQIPRGSGLEFEKIYMEANREFFGGLPLDEVMKQRIQVFTDNQSLTEWFEKPYILDRIGSTERYSIRPRQIDFSEYILLAAFYGLGSSGILSNVTDVWQIENTVFVRAQFFRPDSSPADERYPVETVLVRRIALRHFGELTFKLLDDYGRERAVTTALIPPPGGTQK